jgi:hypothetical protein
MLMVTDTVPPAARAALAPGRIVLRAVVLIAQLHVVVGDHLAHRFQVRHALLGCLAREHQANSSPP